MIRMKNILREGNKKLRAICEDVKLPITDEDKDTLLSLLGYVISSQDEELSKKYGLRPGVGIAAPQIGVLKRMFAIFASDFEGKLFVIPIVNPKILSHSEEIIYLDGGEGCLSVDKPTKGITPRFKSVTYEGIVYNYKTKKFEKVRNTLTDYMAIVFQHEYDHLDGILFVDKVFNEIPNATCISPKDYDDLDEDDDEESTK